MQYFDGILDPKTLIDLDDKAASSVIQKINLACYRAANLEKKRSRGSVSIYSAKLNDADRIVFADHVATDALGERKHYLLALAVFLDDHDAYEEYLKGQASKDYHRLSEEGLDLTQLKPIKAESPDEETASAEVNPSIDLQSFVPYGYPLLKLTDTQNQAVEVKLPAKIGGCAGAGKTVVALKMLQDQAAVLGEGANPILYLGPKKLIESLEIKWQELGIDSPVEVRFMSIEAFALSRMFDGDKEIRGEAEFIDKFNKKSIGKKKLNKGFLRQAYLDCKLIAALGEDFYRKMGERACRFPVEERETIIKLYNRYMAHLTKDKAFDCQLCSLPEKIVNVNEADNEDVAAAEPEVVQNADPDYSFIAVDEAQFMPPCWIKALLALSGNCLALFGDSHQVLKDRLSTDKILSWLFFKNPFNTLMLQHTHRVPPVIAEKAKTILEMTNKLIGGTPEPKLTADYQTYVKKAGSIEFVNSSDGEDLADYQAMAKDPNTAFVVFSEEQRGVVYKQFQTGNVFLASEIVGREYGKVVLVFEFLGVMKKFTPDVLAREVSKNSPGNAELPKELEDEILQMNAVFVALTRAYKHVAMMFDATLKKNKYFKNFIMQLGFVDKKPEQENVDKTKIDETKVDTKKADEEKNALRQALLIPKPNKSWLDEIIDLYNSENYPQAKKNFLLQKEAKNPELQEFDNYAEFEKWIQKQNAIKKIDLAFAKPAKLKRISSLAKQYFLGDGEISLHFREKLKSFCVNHGHSFEYLLGVGPTVKANDSLIHLALGADGYAAFEFVLDVIFREYDSYVDAKKVKSIQEVEVVDPENTEKLAAATAIFVSERIGEYFFKKRKDGTYLYFEVIKNAQQNQDKLKYFDHLKKVTDTLIKQDKFPISKGDYEKLYKEQAIDESMDNDVRAYSPAEYAVLADVIGPMFHPDTDLAVLHQSIFGLKLQGITFFEALLESADSGAAFNRFFFDGSWQEREEDQRRFEETLKKIFSLKKDSKKFFVFFIFTKSDDLTFSDNLGILLNSKNFSRLQCFVDLLGTQDEDFLEGLLNLYTRTITGFIDQIEKGKLGEYSKSIACLNNFFVSKFPEKCHEVTRRISRLKSPLKQLYRLCYACDTPAQMFALTPEIAGKQYPSLIAAFEDFTEESHLDFIREFYTEEPFPEDLAKSDKQKRTLFFILLKSPKFIEAHVKYLFQYAETDEVAFLVLSDVSTEDRWKWVMDAFSSICEDEKYMHIFVDGSCQFLKNTRDLIDSGSSEFLKKRSKEYFHFIQILISLFSYSFVKADIFGGELKLLLNMFGRKKRNARSLRDGFADFQKRAEAYLEESASNSKYQSGKLAFDSPAPETERDAFYDTYLKPFSVDNISLTQLYANLFSEDEEGNFPFLKLVDEASKNPEYINFLKLFAKGDISTFLAEQQDQAKLMGIFEKLIDMFVKLGNKDAASKDINEFFAILGQISYQFLSSSYYFVERYHQLWENIPEDFVKEYNLIFPDKYTAYYVIEKFKEEKFFGRVDEQNTAPSLSEYLVSLETAEALTLSRFFFRFFVHGPIFRLLDKETCDAIIQDFFQSFLVNEAVTQRFIRYLLTWDEEYKKYFLSMIFCEGGDNAVLEAFVSKLWENDTYKKCLVDCLLLALQGLDADSQESLFDAVDKLFEILINQNLVVDSLLESLKDLENISQISQSEHPQLLANILKYQSTFGATKNQDRKKPSKRCEYFLKIISSIEQGNAFGNLFNLFGSESYFDSFFEKKYPLIDGQAELTPFEYICRNVKCHKEFFSFVLRTNFPASVDVMSTMEGFFKDIKDQPTKQSLTGWLQKLKDKYTHKPVVLNEFVQKSPKYPKNDAMLRDMLCVYLNGLEEAAEEMFLNLEYRESEVLQKFSDFNALKAFVDGIAAPKKIDMAFEKFNEDARYYEIFPLYHRYFSEEGETARYFREKLGAFITSKSQQKALTECLMFSEKFMLDGKCHAGLVSMSNLGDFFRFFYVRTAGNESESATDASNPWLDILFKARDQQTPGMLQLVLTAKYNPYDDVGYLDDVLDILRRSDNIAGYAEDIRDLFTAKYVFEGAEHKDNERNLLQLLGDDHIKSYRVKLLKVLFEKGIFPGELSQEKLPELEPEEFASLQRSLATPKAPKGHAALFKAKEQAPQTAAPASRKPDDKRFEK